MTSKKPRGRGGKGATSLAKNPAPKKAAAAKTASKKNASKKTASKKTTPKKRRISIPQDVVAEVLFASDHTCCKCWIAGKDVQVHHIDDDPANNNLANLAVLCFECHNETQVRGGFGRRFSPHEATRYRDDWLVRVRNRRDQADALVIATLAGVRPDQSVGVNVGSQSASKTVWSPPSGQPVIPGRDGLAKYVAVLPTLRQRAYLLVQARNPKTTLDTVESYFDVVAVLREILVALISYYPRNHFAVGDAEQYISGVVSERTHWHYLRSNTEGVGHSGSLVQVQTVMAVLRDLEQMIADMVSSLTGVAVRAADEHELAWHRSWSSPSS